MALTYEPIATTKLTSPQALITFNSIPSTYTDLRLVVVHKNVNDTSFLECFFNDITTGYGNTAMRYNGTTTIQSGGNTMTTDFAWYLGWWNISLTNSNVFSTSVTDILGYASTVDKKAGMVQAFTADDNNTASQGQISFTHWNNTQAITKITLRTSNNFATNTKATLYGIKAA